MSLSVPTGPAPAKESCKNSGCSLGDIASIIASIQGQGTAILIPIEGFWREEDPKNVGTLDGVDDTLCEEPDLNGFAVDPLIVFCRA